MYLYAHSLALRSAFICIRGGNDLTLEETSNVTETINNKILKDDTNVIVSVIIDDSMKKGDKSFSIIGTGAKLLDEKARVVIERAFEILKNFNTFSIGRYDDELKEICSFLNKYDKYYNYRYELYQMLMQEPKFSKYTDVQKIIYAMQMGALDIGECIKDGLKNKKI